MSQAPQKSGQKMCKSPKSTSYQTIKHEKIEYENLSTNCTVVGSNNLNLVKKPQIVTNMSPAYSNPSPGYPPSPYSSPASLKSPSPSLKPPTPQPSFPVMQIIHNNHQLLARPIQTSQPQNIIKLKPHLNILPKPAASPQPSPKPSVSPQIVIPTNHQPAATLMPAAQPLLLNQMPMLAAPGVQFILRPQTATKIPAQMSATATATPQGLILQPGGQPLLQIQPPRSQPMVRVLTNGMHLAPSTTTYVTQMAQQQPICAATIAQQVVNNVHHHHQQQQQTVIKKKPKNKVKKKLDLANIMKLSGIGDEDDIQFESDTSQSESEHTNSVPSTPQSQQPQQNVIQQHQHQNSVVQPHTNLIHQAATEHHKKLGNIQISAMPQATINATHAPVVQVLNQNFQSGVISNSTSQAAAAQAGLPFNSFITPNFTINNGLMLSRPGGFKLTMGEDGRLVLQHDPTLPNQDLQSQLILQSLLGLNGGLVLQPSMDQTIQQQTVQTIQQQSVQTIQQQTVQSQTIQTVQQQTVQPQAVQHALQTLQPQIQQQTVQQTIQHQTVQSQPLTAAIQQPMQIVQPQPIHTSIHSQVQQPQVHSIQSQVQHSLQSIQGQIQSLLQQQQQNHAQAVQQQHQQQQQQHLTQAVQHQQQQQQSVQQNVQQQQIHVPQQSPVQQHTHHAHTQPVLKVQPFQKSQPPVQTVHPQPIQTIHHPPQQQQHQNVGSDSPIQQQQTPTQQYVVNLTNDQLEHLKRNGQVTVNGQTIFMQRSNSGKQQEQQQQEVAKKMSPKIKPVKKANKIQSIKSFLHDEPPSPIKSREISREQEHHIKDGGVCKQQQPLQSMTSPLQTAPKQILPQNHVQPQPVQQKVVVQPSVMVQPSVQKLQQPEPLPKKSPKTVIHHQPQTDSNGANNQQQHHEVEKFLGQLLDEPGNINATVPPSPAISANLPQPHQPNMTVSPQPQAQQPQQRIHTIQLTPQKQQHLKSIQLQIQTLSARLTPGDTEMQNALKLLFNEQQKILATGKVLPPDKVYYHNNQLTIVNPSSLACSGVVSPQPQQQQQHHQQQPQQSVAPVQQIKRETPSPIVPASPQTVGIHSNTSSSNSGTGGVVGNAGSGGGVAVSASSGVAARSTIVEPTGTVHHPAATTPTHNVPRISVSVPEHPPTVPPPVAPSIQHQQHAHANSHLVVNQRMHPPQVNHTQAQPTNITHQHPPVTQHQQQQQFHHPHQQPQQLQPSQFHSAAKKTQLVETQLNLDQNGAIQPDTNTPFKDKKDACIRLIRYHCMDQPVLSKKDLDKADEIFELTARHFIGKYARMVDKYKYLLMKESMRQVQTSELMMLDRMFLAEEQQSLMRLRQDFEEAQMVDLPLSDQASPHPHHIHQHHIQPQQHLPHSQAISSSPQVHPQEPAPPDDYDEWACIQRELGCLPPPREEEHHHRKATPSPGGLVPPPHQNNTHHNQQKRSASSDSRLETLKRFRVDKHHKKTDNSVVHISGSSNSLSNSGSYSSDVQFSSTSATNALHYGHQAAQQQARGAGTCGPVYESNPAHQGKGSAYLNEETEPENNSIDEQVQSAIDSILNLQQNTALDLDSILS